MDQAVKLFPDIQELFCRVFNGYMGRDEDCRVQKRKHLFQFFLQEFLCEMSKKLIRKQSTDKTVRDIMTIMSGDDRRANVDFCLQKALGATSKYDSDVTGEITSQDSVSSIGNSKTTFNSRLRKDIEKASLASQRTLTPGLTQDVLRNIDAMAVDAQTPIAVTAVSSAVSSKQPNAVSSAVSLKQPTAVSSKPPTVASSTVSSAVSSKPPTTVSSAVSSKPPTTVSSAASTKPPTVASSAVSSSASTAVSTKPPTVVSTAVSTKPPTVVSSIVSSVDSDDSDDDDDDSGISKEYLSKMNKPQVGLMARARQMPSIKNNLSDDDDDDDEDDYKEDDDDDSGSGSGSDSDGDTVVKKTPTVNKKKPMKLNNPGKKSPIKKKLPAKKKSPLKKKSPPKKQNIFQKLRN